MARIEDKLAAFSSIVLNMANRQRDELNEQTQNEIDESVEKAEKEFKSSIKHEMEREVQKHEMENREKVLKLEAELKRKLLLKRENIIDEIFGEIQMKIDEFMKSEEYGGWLERKVRESISEIGGGDIIIRIMKKDEKYADVLRDISGCSVELVGDKFTGGIKVYSGNKFIDYSLKTIIADERAEFLQNTDLSVS